MYKIIGKKIQIKILHGTAMRETEYFLNMKIIENYKWNIKLK